MRMDIPIVLADQCILRRSPHNAWFHAEARLAQSAERKALNLVVVGSSPTVGVLLPCVLIGRRG